MSRNLARLSVLIGLALIPLAGTAEAAGLFVVDNDFSGPGGSDLQTVNFFLDNPDTRLLGLTVVTGDDWMNRETAHLLRFLEIAGHPEIPVVQGAVMPLVNTPRRLAGWEGAYGKLSWKGAWNKPETDGSDPAFDPASVPALDEGSPVLKPAPGTAAQFLIEQAHRYPGQVSIIAAGPLTNLALAARLDPDFPHLIKSVIVTNGPGTNFDPAKGAVGVFSSGFNFTFDPEAAEIVMSAPFPQIVTVGPVAENVVVDADLIAAIAAHKTAFSYYLAKNAWKDLPMWDETATAIAVDPTLVTRSVDVLMAIDLNPGATFGSAIAFKDDSAPHRGERKVKVVLDFDQARFKKLFLASLDR